MPKFNQFDSVRIDARSRNHNPPYFHVIGPDFDALIRIDTLETYRGTISSKVLLEVVAWAAVHRNELLVERRRLNERD